MIGPVTSYQSIYVAACGEPFPNFAAGRAHEAHCHACQGENPSHDPEEDAMDRYEYIRDRRKDERDE